MKDSIAIQLVREALRECRLDPDMLLREAGIDPACLSDDTARVSTQSYANLWRTASDRLDDEFFGMDPRPLRRGSFAFLCEASFVQPTLGEGLETALGFLSLMLQGFDAHLVRHPTHIEITLREQHMAPKRAFAYFTYWMIVHGVACWLVGRRIPILAVESRCSPPAFIEDYRVMFTRNLQFECPTTRLMFAAQCLDHPIRRTPKELQRFLARAPANILVRYRAPDGLGRRIRQALRESPAAQWPPVEGLAGRFNTSVSTLRRRLAEEGQSYQTLKDGVRKELAMTAMNDPRMTLEAIAEYLGFEDVSSFHKAFRKWTGKSPGHYRRFNVSSGQNDQRN